MDSCKRLQEWGSGGSGVQGKGAEVLEGWEEGAEKPTCTCSCLSACLYSQPCPKGPRWLGETVSRGSHAPCTSAGVSGAVPAWGCWDTTQGTSGPSLTGALSDSHGSQKRTSVLEKGKLCPHLWFHSPGRKWLPSVWWGALPHKRSRKYGRLRAGTCRGHRAGRVRSRPQNIRQVGTDLGDQ